MGQWRKLPGLRILITGASQGIGRAMALEAAKQGCVVLAAARNAELLAELAAEAKTLNKEIHTVVADVTGPSGRQAMVDADPMTIAELPDETSFKARLQRSGHLADGWLDLAIDLDGVPIGRIQTFVPSST